MADISELTVGQKLLNQRLLAQHCMSEKELKSLWEHLAESFDMGHTTFDRSIAMINEGLDSIGLEIRGVVIESKRYYAMVNLYPDEIAQHAFSSTFEPHEAVYVRQVLELLAEKESLSYSTVQNARNDVDEKHKIALCTTELVIDKMVAEKWLVVSENKKKLSLGPRAFLELGYKLEDFVEGNLPQIIYHRL